MEVEEILNECKDIVEEVSRRYNYDDKDKQGNDSLKTILLRIIPIMLKDSKPRDRNLFYQMLSHTPIVITENLTQEGYDELLEQYIGKDVNQHIAEGNIDLGEYGKNLDLCAGAYVSEPILDENMNLQGKKSFIYIQRVTGKAKEFFGTDINVSHLIHELGHAWHAEKDQFVMQLDGTLKERVGTSEFIYSFSRRHDNKFVKKCTKTTGLMLEEAMNTVEEEKAMAYYMAHYRGISLEEMEEKYRSGSLVPSKHHGYIANFVSYMLDKLGKDDFENYRLYDETESKSRINDLMGKTSYWLNRETDILPSTDSPRSYDKKRAIIDRTDDIRTQEFFSKYETIYFPDISKMTPLEKIDNVLEQKFNLDMAKYNMKIDDYRAFIDILGYEGYSLINQAVDLKRRQELLHVVSDVKSSELSNITQEIKMIALGSTIEKGENTHAGKD